MFLPAMLGVGPVRSCRGGLEQQLVRIAPAPVFTRLEAPHDRVFGLVEMLGGVAIGRIVTAADMAAGEAEPKMDPPAAAGEALLTPAGGLGCHGTNLNQVRTAIACPCFRHI